MRQIQYLHIPEYLGNFLKVSSQNEETVSENNELIKKHLLDINEIINGNSTNKQ
jgi:hypothetical protein